MEATLARVEAEAEATLEARRREAEAMVEAQRSEAEAMLEAQRDELGTRHTLSRGSHSIWLKPRRLRPRSRPLQCGSNGAS